MASPSVPLEVRPDRTIATDVQHALDADRDIPGHVHAQVLDGEVTLTGEVHRLSQKAAAELDACGIRGVRTVKNLIEVRDGNIEPPDDCC